MTVPAPPRSCSNSERYRASTRSPRSVINASRLILNGSLAGAGGTGIGLLAWYPGHWLIALLLLPFVWAVVQGRLGAFSLWMAYYLTCARDIPLACERFFAGHKELSPGTAVGLGIAFWLAQALVLAMPWTFLKPKDRSSCHAWRAIVATLTTVLPPIGIVGWTSPLHVASALFPGWQLAGLLLGLVAIAVMASRPHRPSAFATGSLLAIASALAHLDVRNPDVPAGWAAIDTHFGKLDHANYDALFQRSQAAMNKARATLDSGNQVVILPEETVGLWRASTRLWWVTYIAQLTARGQTVVLGADVQVDEAGELDARQILRHTDSALALGAHRGRLDSRQPVPGGLWRPGAQASAALGSLAQRYLIIGSTHVAFSICYEDFLLWPHWRLFVDRPDVLVSMANDWFAYDLALAQIQRQSVQSIARLVGVPLLRAVNR